MNKMVFIAAVCAVSAGCATFNPDRYPVTVVSDVPYGSLYCGNQRYGHLPSSLRVRLTQENIESGNFLFEGCYVSWYSGVKTNLLTWAPVFKDGGTRITAHYPGSLEQRQQDMDYALRAKQSNSQGMVRPPSSYTCNTYFGTTYCNPW